MTLQNFILLYLLSLLLCYILYVISTAIVLEFNYIN